MGCGSSKQVEVVSASQPTEKEPAKRNSLGSGLVEQESGADYASTSCINQENGESLTRNEFPAAFDAKRLEQRHAIVDESAIGSTTESHHAGLPSQGINDNSSNSHSTTALDGHVAGEKCSTDYRQLFKIIKTAVYRNDTQQIISLRNDIEAIKDDIQNAAFQNAGNLPPIPEDEANFGNPRRVRPARNLLRENAANVALEVSTAYRILENGGVYQKDTVEIERLKNHYGRLQDYLTNVEA